MLLKTNKLMKAFGGLKAINKVDFELPANEIRGIIGPNGSGKSTFFNLVSGVYEPDPGSYIEFDGKDITNEPPHKVGELGLARTFQLQYNYLDEYILEVNERIPHPHLLQTLRLKQKLTFYVFLHLCLMLLQKLDLL